MANRKCADCGKFVAAGKDCECLILLSRLQAAVGDEALDPLDALTALIGDRDFHRKNAQDRHERVLQLIAEKRSLRHERDWLMERVTALEAELERRRPSFWGWLKQFLQEAP